MIDKPMFDIIESIKPSKMEILKNKLKPYLKQLKNKYEMKEIVMKKFDDKETLLEFVKKQIPPGTNILIVESRGDFYLERTDAFIRTWERELYRGKAELLTKKILDR